MLDAGALACKRAATIVDYKDNIFDHAVCSGFVADAHLLLKMSQSNQAPDKPTQSSFRPGVGCLVLLVGTVFFGSAALLGDLLGPVSCFLFALPLLFGSFYQFRQSWRLADTPATTIRAATQGYVELSGFVKGPEIVAPLSGRRCVFWELTVECYVGSGNNASWVHVARVQSERGLLMLDDGTDWCAIWCDLDLSGKQDQRFNALGGLGDLALEFPAPIRSKLQRQASWKVTEQCIFPDQQLFATGYFMTVNSNETPLDNTTLERVKRQGLGAGLFSRLGAKYFGSALDEHYEEQREQWRERMRALEGTGADEPLKGTHRVNVLMSDVVFGGNLPAIVTDRREQAQIKKLRKDALILFVIGAGFFAFGVFLLNDKRPDLVQWLISVLF